MSAMYVETVEKKPGLSKAKSFQGDASKVIIQGTGLKKGFVGRAGTFTLDVKDAGVTSFNFYIHKILDSNNSNILYRHIIAFKFSNSFLQFDMKILWEVFRFLVFKHLLCYVL